MPNPIPRIFYPACLGTAATSSPVQWDVLSIQSFCFVCWLRVLKLPYCRVTNFSRLQWSVASFAIIHALGLIKCTNLALIQVFLSKCWTIQTLIWGASVNCTSKSSHSDPYLQNRAITMGASINKFPTIGVNETNRPLCYTLFSPHKVWLLSCKDLSHTQTLVNCSNNACQSDTCPLICSDSKGKISNSSNPSHLDFWNGLGKACHLLGVNIKMAPHSIIPGHATEMWKHLFGFMWC